MTSHSHVPVYPSVCLPFLAGSSAGSWPDRTELLASSLAHLASVIDALNAQDHELHISLFAGELRGVLMCHPLPAHASHRCYFASETM